MDDAIYNKLKKIVGPEWVSNDPAILVSYSRDVGTLSTLRRPRTPDYVVIPSSVAEVQETVILAREFKIPIYVATTGVNTRSWHIPRRGGILIDMSKRMKKIIEIDEENFRAVVEPGVTFAMLNSELQKRGLYVPVPGAPSTVSVVSNIICHGIDNRGDNKVGWNYRQILGYEIVMADGNIYRIGTWSNEFDTENSYWPHGPGPSAQYMSRPFGIMGVVTKGSVKCWPLGTEFRTVISYFNDIDNVCKALEEIAKREIGHGLLFYAGHKYSSYACDAGFSQYRVNRFSPEFMLAASTCGTKRRVEYEEKIMREIARRNGGRFISERFPPWRIFDDTQIASTANMCSWGAIKYWGWRKPAIGAHVMCTMETMPEVYKIFAKTILEDEWAGNPNNYPRAEFSLGAIAHPAEGAHICRLEITSEGHTQDPVILQNIARLDAKLKENLRAHGFYSSYQGAQPLTMNPSLVEVAFSFRKEVDPDDIFSPATLFPASLPNWGYATT
ncbi:MAG: FAD-binding oxidoreductase [Candidatus Nezhaarchaeota archaeon]|nr:FAD-binding oxidoreductase [Candidatus Nezhaarchaeota archaeon]